MLCYKCFEMSQMVAAPAMTFLWTFITDYHVYRKYAVFVNYHASTLCIDARLIARQFAPVYVSLV